MRDIRNQQQLERANRVALRRQGEGKEVDVFMYKGELGTYELRFSMDQYVPAFKFRDIFLLPRIDWIELEKLILRRCA